MGVQGMSIWHLVCKQTFDGCEKVSLDLEITRGVPSSLCLCVARAEANFKRSIPLSDL
jgi:hypothetical protein